MEENIVMNEEITETAGEIMESTGSGNGLKVFGGIALVAGLAYGGYRLIKKLKEKKEAEEVIEAHFRESIEVDDETEE